MSIFNCTNWQTIAAKPLLRQFLRFSLVGAFGTSLQYLVLWIGVERCGVGAATASGAGYGLGALINYTLNYFFTFDSRQSHRRTACRYFTLLASGWCLNFTLMWLLATVCGWHYWLAQGAVSAVGLLWNFTGSSGWAFRPRRPG